MPYFQITNIVSGADLGLMSGDTKSEAITNWVRLGDPDAIPSDELRAAEVYSINASSRADAEAQILDRLGGEATNEDATSVYLEGETDWDAGIWWVADWDKAVAASVA